MPPPVQAAKSEEKAKATLLAEASVLFAAKGYGATSIRQIAAASNVNIAMISYYYNGKLGLYKACIEAERDYNFEITTAILVPAESTDDVRAKIEELTHAIFTASAEKPYVVQLIERAIQDEGADPTSVELALDVFVRPLLILTAFFFDAQERGLIHLKGTAREIAIIFNSIITQTLRFDALSEKLTRNSIKDPYYRKHLAAVIVHTMFDSMRPVPVLASNEAS